jgi:hypothetical protein
MPETDKTFINGPVNVARMEGKIDGVKKVIYLFMDVHQAPGNETECDDILSKDIKDYLIEQFQKVNDNKMIDFFLESMPSNIPIRKLDEYKGNYINNTIRMFAKAFKKSAKGEVIVNKMFPTIRFHHMDPRDYFEWTTFSSFKNIIDSVDGIWKSMYLMPTDLDFISERMKMINEWMEIVYDYFFKEDIEKAKDIIAKKKPIVPTTPQESHALTFEDMTAQTLSLIKKIKTRYVHKSVMSGVNKILNTYVKKSYDNYIKLDKERLKLFDDMRRRLVSGRVLNTDEADPTWGTPFNITIKSLAELEIHMDAMNREYMDFFVGIMDVYFLRRLLDKDYITNVVAYTGIMHSMNYIYYLSKYFDFKITHVDYVDPKVKDYNREVDKRKSPKDLANIFYPPILKQCSDLSSFPKNFD